MKMKIKMKVSYMWIRLIRLEKKVLKSFLQKEMKVPHWWVKEIYSDINYEGIKTKLS